MKYPCPACQGTGLRMPLCDGPCENPDCKNGQVDKVFEKKFCDFADMEDDDLVSRLWEIENLNDWEYEFRDSVTDWIIENSLTDKQRKKVEQILEKA